jgi:hypothetical protein
LAFLRGVNEECEEEKVTTKQLRAWFDEYNSRYFKGKLKRPAIVIKDLEGELGRYDLEAKRITVSRRIVSRPELARRVLIHEMAHLVSLGHKGRYLSVLDRLKNLGEEWAEKELALYRGDWIVPDEFDTEEDWDSLVRGYLESIALLLIEKNIRPDLRRVKRILARLLDIDPAEVEGVAPHWREEWHKIKGYYF